MKRYDVSSWYSGPMHEFKDGEYVTYQDHLDEIAEKDRLIETLNKQIDQLHNDAWALTYANETLRSDLDWMRGRNP